MSNLPSASETLTVPRMCINGDHLVVEPKGQNEERKACGHKVAVKTRLEDGTVLSLPPAPCPHLPPCVFPVEWRVASRM